MIKLWRFLSVPIVLAVCLGLMLVPGAPPQVALAQGTVGLEVVPNMTTVGFTEDFDLEIWTNAASNQSIDGVGAFLNFSPTYMLVNSITPGAALDTVLGADFNNTLGTIDYNAGKLTGTKPTGDFVVCTINCTSKSVAGVSTIEFVIDGVLRETDVTLNGSSIINWGMVVNGTLTVIGRPVLTVDVVGSGNVTINGTLPPSYPNTTNWTQGENVTLEAFPAAGWAFEEWTGNLTGSTNPDNITMDGDKNVTANFTELPPQISADPPNLTFSATVGGANPANQALDICNSGGEILNWTANITGTNVSWLSMSPMNGTNLTNGICNYTQVAVNITNMTAGTYYANITITAPGASNSPHEVLVTLNLGVPGAPAISVSPIPLTFTAVEGEDPPDQTLTVCNSGTGTLNWSLTDNAGWLSESPKSGSLGAGKCENVVVSADVAGMELGDYSATITFTGSLEKKVPVTLHIVSALPEMLVGPASLSASALSITPQQVQSGLDVTISINVANTGGATGSYNAVLYINGVVEDSQSVSVAAGISKNVIFTVSKTKAGVYDVSLAGQSGQFEVVGGGWFGGGLGTGGIIAIVVVVIILIGAVVFILRGTTRPE